MADAENHALIEQLEQQTKFMSSPHQMMRTEAAQQIREQGWTAVPMLLQALRDREIVSAVMTLLAEITDHSPVKEEDRGHVSKMVEAWLEWGEGQGYE